MANSPTSCSSYHNSSNTNNNNKNNGINTIDAEISTAIATTTTATSLSQSSSSSPKAQHVPILPPIQTQSQSQQEKNAREQSNIDGSSSGGYKTEILNASVATNMDLVHSNDNNSIQMESLEDQTNHLSLDEIPEPIKVLDDIISEFEDTSKPIAIGNGNGENQSEDDGYMSLSRKNMHKPESDEMPETSTSCASLDVPNKCFQEIEIHIKHNGDCKTEISLNKTIAEPTTAETLIQTTLPKVRPIAATATNYSSLPCCGLRSSSLDHKVRIGSCNGERNILGIDISAVHKAVLRGGVAKLPEPMLNEHPVTIYPGRYSPTADGARSSRPHRLITSVEKHKEVCQILNPLSSISSSSSSSSTSTDNNKLRGISPTNIIIRKCNKNPNSKVKHKPTSEYEYSDDSLEEQSLSPTTISSASSQLTPNKQTGIAWEIHFNSKKKTTKSLTKSTKKHADSTKLMRKTSDYKSAEDLYDDDDDDDSHDLVDGVEMTDNATDNLSYYMPRHTNMLGKGTFIIRRSSKKEHHHPKAKDIFKIPTISSSSSAAATKKHLKAEYVTKIECHERSPMVTAAAVAAARKQTADIYKLTDNFNAKPRHSLDLNITQCSSLTSPRDRLSLNIESQRHSSLTKEANYTAKPIIIEKSSPEEFIKAHKKGNFKQNSNQRSTESINNKSPSLASLDEETSKDFEIAENTFEETNNLLHKTNIANGTKTQEYNELRSSNTTTPHTDLAPTLEEEEEQYSDFSYGAAPLQQIESNISALLRGEISMVRAGEAAGAVAAGLAKRPLEFRPGVHKSESAKEMLLSQNAFGPLPPSPPSSNPDLFDYDDLPPLPPSPTTEAAAAAAATAAAVVIEKELPKPYLKTATTSVEIHKQSTADEIRSRDNKVCVRRHFSDDLPPPPPTFENLPPAVPPHRGHSTNTIKSWSIDSNYKKRSPFTQRSLGYGSGITTPTGVPQPPPHLYESGVGGSGSGQYSAKRYVSYGTKRSLKQSPREEHRLQTSCSLPETPIFARGCDIPRTPYRRQNEGTAVSGSRTAPRSSTSHSINMGTSIVGIAGGTGFGTAMSRQRSINHALASNEMLRLSGVPARGWYPKQRTMRPVSTENIDRLTSVRVWDTNTGMSGTGQARKPLTLPPNLTPSFLNKSPREALRRVTSLLITKKKNTKERKNKPYSENTLETAAATYEDTSSSTKPTARTCNNAVQKTPKKKGLFKNLWKKTKHVSIDQ